MKKVLLLAILAFSFVFSNAQEIVSNQVLIQTADQVSIDDILKRANVSFDNAPQIRLKRTLNENLNIYLVSHLDVISEEDLVNRFYQLSGVLNAQLNHKVQLRETTPLDPEYGNQWHHQNIDSELAWDITTGGLTAAGDEIVVCVIEGGNAEHVDLQDNAWSNTQEIADNGIDDDGNGYIDDVNGWNVASEDDEDVFQGGHGTQVMGMIGAKGDNDLGVVGANWIVKIMSVAGENIFDEATLVEAYGYPLDMRNLYEETGGAQGAFVVATNASWGIDGGNPEDSPIWCGLYQTLGEAGILNCGATANNNVDVDQVGDLPTACASDYMISVTATNNSDERTFSGYGQTTIDLGAPGEDVWTTSGNNGYGSTSGTSFASPLTAGVIALLYSAPCPSLIEIVHSNPQAGADLIRQALFDGVDPIDNLTTECVTGGRINSFNSLNLLLETCESGVCFAPFSSTQITLDNVSFAVEWSSASEENSYGFRYKLTSDLNWTEVLDLSDGYYDLGELEWCSEYEYQLKTFCPEDISTEWTSSTLITTDGCCVSPPLESLSLEVTSETGATLTWPSVLAAEGFNIVYSQLGGLATTIENVTGTSYDLIELEPCTDYDISVYSVCSGGTSPENNIIYFTTTGCGACSDISYCYPEIANTADEWISLVQVGTYEFTSGNDQGYLENLESGIVINRSSIYELSVEFEYEDDTFNESVAVWIDYNQDGNFTTAELLANDPGTQTTLTSSFTVPADAPLGLTRMRVSLIWSGDVQNIQDPCEDFDFGETEDYCVTIEEFDSVSELSSVSVAIFPNPASSELTISSVLLNSSYRIVDLTGRTVLAGSINSSNHSINIESLTNGTYILSVDDESGSVSQSQFVKM